jgi:hypothetical protein
MDYATIAVDALMVGFKDYQVHSHAPSVRVDMAIEGISHQRITNERNSNGR